MKIACIGDNCIDRYDDIKKESPGGNPVNVAVYCKRLGFESSYIGAVGDDVYGEMIVSAIRSKGVDVSHVRTMRGSSTVSHVTMKDGERVFGDYDEGAMADFRPTEEDIDFMCSHNMVVTDLWGHSEGALEEIHRRGVPTAFDASEKPFAEASVIAAPWSTLFFFSDDSSTDEELFPLLKKIREMGPEAVIAMRGSRGSAAYNGKSFFTFGIIPCEIVDTLGAGDSYVAGFVTAWLQGQPIPECMRSGAGNASRTIGYFGAW